MAMLPAAHGTLGADGVSGTRAPRLLRHGLVPTGFHSLHRGGDSAQSLFSCRLSQGPAASCHRLIPLSWGVPHRKMG